MSGSINTVAGTPARDRPGPLVAAAFSGGAVSLVTALGTGMSSQAPYGVSQGAHYARQLAPMLALLALPAAVGAGTSSFVGGGLPGVGAGAAMGGVVGAAIGSGILHMPGLSRLGAVALALPATMGMGAVGAALSLGL